MDLSKPKRIEDRNLLNSFHRMRCAACDRTPCDPAHIRSIGAGGPDLEWNLMPLCRRHHSLQHSVGWGGLVIKFPSVWLALESKGWEWSTEKLWNEKLGPKS